MSFALRSGESGLNLSDVRFMDSTGLTILIRATNDARRDGWELKVGPDVSPQVRRLFQTAGVAEHLLGPERPSPGAQPTLSSPP